jgi:RNA exonuclease 4
MVGVGPIGEESALAKITITNWENQVIFETHVKVDQFVTDFRTSVSGIRSHHLQSRSAMNIQEVRYFVSKILRGKILIGHGLENDLRAIGISHPWQNIRDTATYQPLMYMRSSKSNAMGYIYTPKKLKDLAWEQLGKRIQVEGKPHNPREDAITAMKIYQKLRNEWESQNWNTVQKQGGNIYATASQLGHQQYQPLRTVSHHMSSPQYGHRFRY